MIKLIPRGFFWAIMFKNSLPVQFAIKSHFITSIPHAGAETI